MKRVLFSSVKSLALITAGLVLVAAVSLSAQQTPTFAGVWKLNEALSNNPNGPAPVNQGRRGGGSGGGATGGGRGGGGASVDVTGGSRPNQSVSELSPEETQRIRVMLGLMNKAAQSLEIIVDGKDVQIKQDGTGFPKQTSDGKKSTLKNAQIGEVDIKIKIDAKGMTREIKTEDDLKVEETYTLSADGKQLTVTMKASQPVMKIEDVKIKRVYDRQ